jgi:CheY-like chemotaxis protein
MRRTRLLFCDDEGEARELYRRALTNKWPKLFNENVDVDTCEDIVIGPGTLSQRTLNEVGTYDALVLDLLWKNRTQGPAHGVTICKIVREKFPELPIIIVSKRATEAHFRELIPLSINAYLSKRDSTVQTWCAEIKNALDRATLDRAGLRLYQLLRELLIAPGAWNSGVINEAASQVWRHESSHDKWNTFWEAMSAIVGTRKIRTPFDLMKDYFASSDLMTLGALPSMRGHLEHVLYVYFTGYVLSHRLPSFKEIVLGAIPDVLGRDVKPGKEEYYWDLFQLAWLTAATLHDTAYSLELLPDFPKRAKKVQNTFPFAVAPALDADAGKCSFDWSKAKVAKHAFETTLSFLGYPKSDWIVKNATFLDKDGVRRINHGVASGALFIEKFTASCEHLAEKDDLIPFFNWAATAMALHSLKNAENKEHVALKLERDPLAFLLLLCDELQVWNRERPDNADETSVFRRTELASLTISDNKVVAGLTHVPYSGVIPTQKEHGEELSKTVTNDNAILSRYLDVGPLEVEIVHAVRGAEIAIPSLTLQKPKTK